MTKIKGSRSDYIKGLESNEYWERVKRKIKMRDGFTCQISGKRINLSVHHIAYFVFIQGRKIDIRGQELDFLEWLILLNQDEHEMVHENNSHALNPRNQCKIDALEFKRLNNK